MAAICGLIWSFTNVGYDCGYQLSMAYRFLQGDRLFVEMWEPHQLSVFLPAALMWVYRSLFHTTTGIVIYLQMCGMLFRGALALLLYRVLRDDIDEPLAYGMGLLYFMLSPKDYAIPDFGNQQLWYLTLLLCGLVTYLKKGKLRYLFWGGISLCLGVMAYPSCALVLPGVVVLLYVYSPRRWRDILLFSGVCAGAGAAFCVAVLPEPEVLLICLKGMTVLEPTHTVNLWSKLSGYLKDILEVCLVVLAAGVLGWGISRSIRAFTGKRGMDTGRGRGSCGHWIWLLCCAGVMLAAFLINILSVGQRDAYGVLFLSLVGVGVWESGILQGRKKQLYICGSVIGGVEFLATLILTNLWLTVSVVYGLLAIIMALIPIEEQLKKLGSVSVRRGMHRCGMCLIALLALRCAYIRTPLTGRGQICSTFSDLSVVRVGPALGLISNEEGVCIQRDSYPEWKALVRPGDNVWIVGGVIDNMQYLYEDVQVAGPSTISTPTYNSEILEYWRLNPDKYPDVVVAEGYLGELSSELLMNQWLMNWLEEEYQPVRTVKGTYWVYYFREER